ncbi:MAG: hypothetical protein KAJ05_08640 [Candidatus Latescibacteria bacterium]|nr:hypothetical protein [Candidatus Latescibacterota bacterium]
MDRSKWVKSLESPEFELRIGPGGGMEIIVGGESYLLESSFSFPGERICVNLLSEQGSGDDPEWKPVVKRTAPSRVEITANGAFYELRRTISLEGHRLSVEDALTNRSREDVGVLVRNRIFAAGESCRVLLGGAPGSAEIESLMSENPTILLSQTESQVGLLAEDTLSRLQFQAQADRKGAEFSLNGLAIQPGQSRTLRWAITPMRDTDYFAFINQVRRDWKANFTVFGPWDFFDVTSNSDLLHDPEKLRAYLNRKKLKVVAFQPWLDYDDFDYLTGRPTNREEYKALMIRAMAAFKAVDPDIRCVGCMEGNIVSLPPEAQRVLYGAIPANLRTQGIRPFTDQQMELIEMVDLPWRDCLLTAPDGRYSYELYYRGEDRTFPMMAILVYAAPGNGQMKYWLDQARFMMEEVGLDGVYIDQFSLAFTTTPDYSDPTKVSQRYSYERWDGVTVDMDPATGKILRRYTDGALVGVGARKALMEYVRSQGGIMVANTHCAAEELQSCPVVRFMEAEWVLEPLKIGRGEEPPLHQRLCKGQLNSPVALGFRPERLGEEGRRNYAEVIMKSVITYLRHGLLWYHYVTEIPKNGEGCGEYGPINRMFPLTPVELHKGWILGKERIISCVSVDTFWEQEGEPVVRVFDLSGREKDSGDCCRIKKEGGKWRISLRLEDWREIAVVETEGTT